MCGSHESRSTHSRRRRSPPKTNVLVGPCASSRIVPALCSLIGQGRLPGLVIRDGHADERVGVQRELDVRRRDRVHEPGLLLDAGVLVDIAQLDDRP